MKEKTSPADKKPAKKMSDEAQVADYMERLEHPLKAEMEALRAIIKAADPAISERIKWNAPSYYSREDILTFNHRMPDKVHLIFHHKTIVQIKSDLLEGDYKDRRMVYFNNMDNIRQHQAELERIIRESVALVEKGG